jgi:hypothetical protein
LEHLFDDDVQLVSFAENDLAPDTSRDSNEEMDFEPSTLRSRELSSGIRSKADEEFDSTGVQVDEILDPGQESSKYEISAQGTIKTLGDRNLPPFVISSLDPDSERGIGSKHGRKAA